MLEYGFLGTRVGVNNVCSLMISSLKEVYLDAIPVS